MAKRAVMVVVLALGGWLLSGCPTTTSSAGCTKDVDCKGDRICGPDGRCVAPGGTTATAAVPEARPPAAETAATPAPVAGARGGVLAWVVSGEVSTSVWLPDGGEPITQPGVWISTGDALWAWTSERVPVATCVCDENFDCGKRVPDGGSATVAYVEQVGGGARHDFARAPSPEDVDGSGDWVEQTVLLGSVGPYLFVRHAGQYYGCGAAHPSCGGNFDAWDVATGKAPVLLTPTEYGALKGREMSEACAVLNKMEFPDPITPADLSFTVMTPVFDPSGALHFDYQFTAGTFGAASDCSWGYGTTSATIKALELPAALRPWAQAPPELSSWLAEHSGSELRGWSRVTEGSEAARSAAGLFGG